MNLKNIVKNNSNKKNMFYLYSIVFVVNLICVTKIKMPHVFPDAFIPLSISAFFTGHNWSEYVSTIPFYFGYIPAILYIPIFLIIKSPINIYRGIVVINSIIISFVPVICYHILFKYLGLKKKKDISIISLIIGLFPSYLILSKTTWNETFFIIIPWICFTLLIKECKNDDKRTKTISSIILGILLIIGYATHGRFIALIVTVFVIGVAYRLIYKNHKLIYFIPFIITVLISAIINNIIVSYLIRNLWLVNDKSLLNNTLEYTANQFINAGILETIKSVLVLFIGQVFYAQLATLGLIGIGIVISVYTLYKIIFKRKVFVIDNSEFILNLFPFVLLICSIGMAIVKFTSLISSGTEYGSYYIYGRYAETMYPIYIFIVLYYISTCKISVNMFKVSKIILIVTIALLLACVLPEICKTKAFADMNTLMTYAFGGKYLIGVFNPFNALIVCCIVLLVIYFIESYFISHKKIKVFYILIISVFLFSYLYIAKNLPITHSNNVYNKTISSYETINDFGDIYSKYDIVYILEDDDVLVSSYQFLLEDYNIIKLNEDDIQKGNLKENSIIISRKDYNLEFEYNNCYRVNTKMVDGAEKNYIWINGNELYSELISRNISLAENNKKVYDNSVFRTNDDRSYQGEFEIKPKYYSMGPWEPIYAGTYVVKISGENLDEANIDVCYDEGKKLIEVNNLKCDSKNIEYELKIENYIPNIEFRIWNNSNKNIIFKGITIEKIQ